ncbi:MAG TPA: NUDIX domain-containing protein [Planctomycetota bacterium]|nr:NUDIX domain-containing protein [Planctomycetota bacterium]
MAEPLSPRDAEFLKTYDASRYEHPSVAVDLCIFSIVNGALTVHLVERKEPPCEGRHSLPGGFVRIDESLEDAARRVLREKARLEGVYVEQLYTFGEVGRDPRTRVITVAYYALIGRKAEELPRELTPFPVSKLPPLAFDHNRILEVAVTRIQGKLDYTTIAFELMPREFTLTELQKVYEIILERRLAKPAFRRRILASGVVKETTKMRRGGHRPAILYRFVEGRRG